MAALFQKTDVSREIARRLLSTSTVQKAEAVMDRYSMFVVARYFKTRQDYINLMAVCKKYGNLVEMFRYNPIDDYTLFPMVQTQHFYSRDYLRYKRDSMAGYVRDVR